MSDITVPADPTNPTVWTLHVTHLGPSVTEEDLNDVFNVDGSVESIRLDARSHGCAYLRYETIEDAERAFEKFKHPEVKGKRCYMTWPLRDSALHEPGPGRICVKNLDPMVDQLTLRETFASYGNILFCKLVTTGRGRSKGYGFVLYDNDKDAESAINYTNGTSLCGKEIIVEPCLSIEERFTNVCVNNIDPKLDWEGLKEIFVDIGNIASAVIQVDHEGKSKGFGYVNFEDHASAVEAVEAFHNREYDGRLLDVSIAKPQSKVERKRASAERWSKYRESNLYIRNLDDHMGHEWLRANFESFGTIVSAKVMFDSWGRHKGNGFVCFSSQEAATKAIEKMDGERFGSKPLKVTIAQLRRVKKIASSKVTKEKGLRSLTIVYQ